MMRTRGERESREKGKGPERKKREEKKCQLMVSTSLISLGCSSDFDTCDLAVASSSSLQPSEDSPKLLESYRSGGFDTCDQAVASSSSLRLTEDSP